MEILQLNCSKNIKLFSLFFCVSIMSACSSSSINKADDYSKKTDTNPKNITFYLRRAQDNLTKSVDKSTGMTDKSKIATDDLNLAINDASKAIELDPQNVIAYEIRGCAYNCLGQYQKAIDDCSKAIELDPKCSAYTNRAAAYHMLGKDALAEKDLLLAPGTLKLRAARERAVQSEATMTKKSK